MCCPNPALHDWLNGELAATLAGMGQPETVVSPEENRRPWERWQEGFTVRITPREKLTPLRMLLVLDNLTGHKSVELVLWLFDHGIMPLYTPLGGSSLNMTESVQRIIKRRALEGQHPRTTTEIIIWLEAAARGWNAEPTPSSGAEGAWRGGEGHGRGGIGSADREPGPPPSSANPPRNGNY